MERHWLNILKNYRISFGTGLDTNKVKQTHGRYHLHSNSMNYDYVLLLRDNAIIKHKIIRINHIQMHTKYTETDV